MVRTDILTKDYPPSIYGGAGVHVAELVRALRARDDIDVRVHAFGGPRDEDGTTSHPDLPELDGANAALSTMVYRDPPLPVSSSRSERFRESAV